MSSRATSQFNIENWDETVFSKADEGPKLIRASVKKSFTGDIEGEGVLEYLMTTFNEKFSTFIGTEQITGRLEGRSGSFTVNHEGTFKEGVANGTCRIVPGSGTDELSGIGGEGSYEATHEQAELTLNYHFE